MYNRVNTLPVTGFGTTASAGAAYAVDGIWFWVFVVLAVFTLVGAVGAVVRTAPSTGGFFYREPKRLAPENRPRRRE